MRLSNLLIFSILVFFNSFSLKGAVVNEKISNKYDQIFSKKILSTLDITIYSKIFEYQDACKWKLANKYILKIQNNILMGHVLAQRYLHPKCYQSQYLELSSWLKKYNDYPQAKRIYRLAIKRMPKGYKRPLLPSKVIGIEASRIEL